jgi:transposase
MKFVATKTADQLDLQALHRVRSRLVGQRTGIINQNRAFLVERVSRASAHEGVDHSKQEYGERGADDVQDREPFLDVAQLRIIERPHEEFPPKILRLVGW